MILRAIRGATTVAENTQEAILKATAELLSVIIERNGLTLDQFVSVIFTATRDLNAVYPAVAARELGWTDVPLLCMQEMYVDGSLSQCVRVLIHIQRKQEDGPVKHVYLRGARVLRPDLVGGEA